MNKKLTAQDLNDLRQVFTVANTGVRLYLKANPGEILPDLKALEKRVVSALVRLDAAEAVCDAACNAIHVGDLYVGLSLWRKAKGE